jgi:hypothetical protein
VNEEIPMTACADYATLYETEFRPRRRARRLLAYVVLAALFLIRPSLAIQIWVERA